METGRVVDFDEVREFFVQNFSRRSGMERDAWQVTGMYKNGDVVGLSNISEDFDKVKNYKKKLEEKLQVTTL